MSSMGQNKIARGAIWVIMGLVLVGLVGFGSFNFGTRADAIGRVGETPITANRYYREVTAQLNAIEQQFGTRLPFSQAQAFGVDQQALKTVIDQVALENESARLGISVGDSELAARIRDIPAFAGVDGQFDRDAYNFVLERSGLKAREFEQSLRSEVARTILQGAVGNGVAVQPVFVRTLYGWARETRDFTWAKVDASVLDAPVSAPTDDALTAYYEAHPDAYTLPETRKITYGWLGPDDVLDQVEVSEDDLKAAYEARIDEYQQPERRLVERLVFGSATEAEVAAQRLADGATTFPDLVAERGLQLADIDLGDVTERELGGAGPAVFALAGTGTTGVVTSDLGPAIFRVNAVLAAQETSFEEARDALRKELAAEDARRLLDDMATGIDDALAGGATLEDLGNEFGVKIASLDWTGAETDGIAAYDSFREAAAAVSEDDYPAVEHLPDGGLFALRLDTVVPPTLQPLDAVRDRAVADWTAEETVKQVNDKAQEMLGSFAAGGSPASLGLIEVTETGKARDDQITGAPPALVEAAFGLETGAWQVVADADGAIVVRLDAVHAADQDSPEAMAAKSAFAGSQAQAMSADVQDAFAAALEAEAGITLDQAMINAVNAQFQ